MSGLNRRAAKELTKTVTFTMLDNLAERCLGQGTQTKIVDSEDLLTNLYQEFDRFGPDSFSPSRPVTDVAVDVEDLPS